MAEVGNPRGSGRKYRLGRIALGIVAALGFAVALVFAGFEAGKRQFFPHAFLDRVDRKIEWTFFRNVRAGRLEEESIPTALLQLQTEVGIVDFGRDTSGGPLANNGGGLTSFGREVLLLAFDGNVYAAEGPDSIRRTNVSAPDNNRSDFAALADDPDFDDYQIRASYLRYNDLEYFKTDEGQGLIASYTEYHPDEVCYTNTLARLDLPQDATSIDGIDAGPDDWDVIYRTSPCLPLKRRFLAMEGHMASGKIAFEAPGTLYLSSGDFHLDGMRSNGPPIAQNPEAEYGKMLAMDLEGQGARIVSMGHRNVQGMVLAPDKRLFASEHGPQGGDEINLIQDGRNYGWPTESYGLTYSSTPIPRSVSFGRHESFEEPIHSWVPSAAISGITYVDGFHSAWDGDLLVASLIDHSLFRLRLEDNEAVYAERIEIGTRLRDVHQHTDGRIVLWTDNQEMVFLTGADKPGRALTVEDYIEVANLGSRTGEDLAAELDRCAECHSFQADESERAPSLARIHGAAIASTSYEGYTNGLKAQSGEWTDENLRAYLSDPQAFAPGTAMPPVQDTDVLEHVVGYLKELDRQF